MGRKNYEYKHLTDEMKKMLDKEIRKIGRSNLYEKIEHNVAVERVSKLQNEEGAFKEISRGPWRTTQWEYKYFTEPVIVDVDNLNLDQEILHYIDHKRFSWL